MKQMTRDEHGYINGRGKSKYWGVTTSVVDGSRKWVISHQPKWSPVTVGHHAHGFTLKEVDAARIASFLYEQSMYAGSAPQSQFILSCDKKYVYWVDPTDSRITREKMDKHAYYLPNPNLTLDLGDNIPEAGIPKGKIVIDQAVTPAQKSKFAEIWKALQEEEQEQEQSQSPSDWIKEKKEAEAEVAEINKLLDEGFDERKLIAFVTDAVLSNKITPTGIRILIGVLESA